MRSFLLFFFILFTCSSVFSQNNEASDKLVDEGIVLHDAGNYEGAIKLYDQALELDPKNVYALAEKAYSQTMLGESEAAISTCQRALELEPEDDVRKIVYVTYGTACDDLGNSKKAIEVYDEGLKIFPEYYQLYFNKGVTLANQGEYDDALYAFNQGVIYNPQHSSSHNGLARMMLFKEKRIPTLLCLWRFLVLEPEGPRAVENLALMEELMGAYVTQKDKKSISISIPPEMMGDTLPNGAPKKNSFIQADLILTMISAMDFEKKNQKKAGLVKFINKFESVVSTLKETQAENYGFFWDYYVPYFIELNERGHTEAFAYLLFISKNEKSLMKWIDKHEDEIREFLVWSNGYEWSRK